MLYKADTPVKCYKSLGNVTVKNYDGTQTLETIPWYSEQRVYKGDSEYLYQAPIVYPCFDVTKKHTGNISAYHDIPSDSMEAMNLYYSAASANAVPSSLNIFSNITGYKHGYFKYDSSNAEIGDLTQIFDEGDTSYSNKVMLGLSTTTASNNSGMNIINNIYQYVDFNGVNDITILANSALSDDKDIVNAFYSGTFLTNKDVSQIDLDILIAGSSYDSSLPKTGASSIGVWTNTTQGSTSVETTPIAVFDNLKLWNISAGSNFQIDGNSIWIHIAPKFVFHNSLSNNYHIMATNLFVSLFLSKQGT